MPSMMDMDAFHCRVTSESATSNVLCCTACQYKADTAWWDAGFTDFLAPLRGGPRLARFMDIVVLGLGPFFNASILLSAVMFTGFIPSWKEAMERLQKQGREVRLSVPSLTWLC